MAVKKHEVVEEHHQQEIEVDILEQYITMMNTNPTYVPSQPEIIKHCEDIVRCLAGSTFYASLFEVMETVEDFLLRLMDCVCQTLRQEIIYTILEKLHYYTSDVETEACPATTIVFVVLDSASNDTTLSAARWIVQQWDHVDEGESLRTSLACFYKWLALWHGTPGLGEWVMAYIKALEENEQFHMLNEVSVKYLCPLFLALDKVSKPAVFQIIFHILSSLRDSKEAFDKIAPHVSEVMSKLADDSSPLARQVLQNVADILTAMIDRILGAHKGKARADFCLKYAGVINCLSQYMASRDGNGFLPVWQRRSDSAAVSTNHVSARKAGLINLGNTCYFNSVIQALLVTRQFSNHAMMNKYAAPYWCKIGNVFAKMLFSLEHKVTPDEFYNVMKSPFFTNDHQHDSSEFLAYLFDVLQTHEGGSEAEFDYSQPATAAALAYMQSDAYQRTQRAVTSQAQSESSGDVEQRLHSSKASSSSPSTSGSSSGSSRRTQDNDITPFSNKRMRVMESGSTGRDSFVDTVFGGVQQTRVECLSCKASSLSRDSFRDLQLAFPEKAEGGRFTVQSLLDYYCSIERLSGDNKYNCRDCGGLRNAERSVLIESSPKYLILVLKYFKYDPKTHLQTKLMHSTYHNYTITLPSVRSQNVPQTYTLYAAVVHEGTSLNSGHYFTIAKDTDQWYVFNDEVVKPAKDSELNTLHSSCTPYMLFYRMNDGDEVPAVSLEELPPATQENVLASNKLYVEQVEKMQHTRP